VEPKGCRGWLTARKMAHPTGVRQSASVGQELRSKPVAIFPFTLKSKIEKERKNKKKGMR
jgi:hypothetical protein